MKSMTIVVESGAGKEVLDRLRGAPEILSLTAQSVEVYSEGIGAGGLYSAVDRVLGFVPKVRLDLLVEDGDVAAVVARLSGSDALLGGRGHWWITPVDKMEPL